MINFFRCRSKTPDDVRKGVGSKTRYESIRQVSTWNGWSLFNYGIAVFWVVLTKEDVFCFRGFILFDLISVESFVMPILVSR